MVRRLLAAVVLLPLTFLSGAGQPYAVVLLDAPAPMWGSVSLPFMTGDVVPVLGRRPDAVQVSSRQGPLWVPAAAVAILGDSQADAQLYARGWEDTRLQRHLQAIALYTTLATRLPGSPYTPMALLQKAREAEWLGRAGAVKDAAMWGVHFRPRADGRWQYDGAAYAEILLRFPQHHVAEEALYGQIATDSEWSPPWADAGGPLAERRRWEFFRSKYPHSPYEPAVWLRWCFLTSAAADLLNPGQHLVAVGYRRQVDLKLRELVQRYPTTEIAARARRAVAFLQGGGHVAGPATNWPFETRF